MNISIELCEAYDYAESVNIYNEGQIITYYMGDVPFDDILSAWKLMIKPAHEMPAFGVSLNNQTKEAIKSGLWIEFVFNRILESNGMPYEKLLINIETGSSGFNLIRYLKPDGYCGRCFYYDLVGRTMSSFYDVMYKYL